MEGTSSEKQEAVAAMNWENRLKKARAQREAILRERAAEEPGSNGLQPISIVEMAEKLRSGTSGDTTPPTVEKKSVPAQSAPVASADAKHSADEPGNPFRFTAPEQTRSVASDPIEPRIDPDLPSETPTPPSPVAPVEAREPADMPSAPIDTPSEPLYVPSESVTSVSAKQPLDEPEDLIPETTDEEQRAPSTDLILLPVEPVAEPRPVWKRVAHIGLGFCVGIGVGLGIMTYQAYFPDGIRLTEDTTPESSTAPDLLAVSPPDLAPVAPAALDAPEITEAQEESVALFEPIAPLEPAAEPAALELPVPIVFSDLGLEIVSPAPLVATRAPVVNSESPDALLELAALSAPTSVVFPDAGDPPQVILQVPQAPQDENVLTLQTTAPSQLSLDPILSENGADARQLAGINRALDDAAGGLASFGAPRARPVLGPGSGPSTSPTLTALEPPFVLAALTADLMAAPSDPTVGVRLAALQDDLPALVEPAALTGMPEPGVAPPALAPPLARSPVPTPVIEGAERMIMWIFAAGTVSSDRVASAQGIVEGYNLPVGAVNRVNYLISRNQVRYYDASTAEAAERIAKDIGATARDFTTSGVNPAPGTLEIYLAGEPTSAPVRSVQRAPAPVRAPQPSEAEILRQNVLSKLRSGIAQ